MKTIKVQGKIIRSEDYVVRSAVEVESGLEVNTPSLLVNLLSLKKRLLPENHGFQYTFPLAFDRRLETNGFKITFPLIFE